MHWPGRRRYRGKHRGVYALRHRHRGVYRPRSWWTCPKCTADCGCPILLSSVMFNTRFYGVVPPMTDEIVRVELVGDEGVVTIPVLEIPALIGAN